MLRVVAVIRPQKFQKSCLPTAPASYSARRVGHSTTVEVAVQTIEPWASRSSPIAWRD